MSSPPTLMRRRRWPGLSQLPPTPRGKRCFRVCGRWRGGFANSAAGQWLLPAATFHKPTTTSFTGRPRQSWRKSSLEYAWSRARPTGRAAPSPRLWRANWRTAPRCRRPSEQRRIMFGRQSPPPTHWEKEVGRSITECETPYCGGALSCGVSVPATKVEAASRLPPNTKCQMLPFLLLQQNPRQHRRDRSQQPFDPPKLHGLPLHQGLRLVEDADARRDNQADDAQDKEHHARYGETEAPTNHGHIEKVGEGHGSGDHDWAPIALISADVTKTRSRRVLAPQSGQEPSARMGRAI